MLVALAGFAAALILIIVRVPIFVALGAVGYVGLALLLDWNRAGVMLAITARESTMTYNLVVVPLFVLMGNLVAGSGISMELFRTAQSWLGHRKGGLAQATIAACAGFAAVCGSSVATVVTIGRSALPAMDRQDYAGRLSTAAVAAGSTLGIIIPPSVMLVIYGIITETHIGMLYAAGLVPGLLGVIGYMAAVRWSVYRRPDAAPVALAEPWSARWRALGRVWPVCLLFIIVLGGIYAGYFTAAEAAGIGALGALLLTLARRRTSWSQLVDIFVDTALTSAVLFALMIGAAIFTQFLNFSGAHRGLLDFINAVGISPVAVILTICAIYIVLGALMEELSMMLLTVPLFFPIVTGLGYDPVWFGILVIVLCEIGMIAPPIGVNLFVVRSIAPRVPLREIVSGIIPFITANILRVLLIALVPAVTLYLPNLLF